MHSQAPRQDGFGDPGGHAAAIGSVAIYTVGLIGQKSLATNHDVLLIAFWQFALAAAILWLITAATDGIRGGSARSFLIPLIWGILAPGASLIINMIGSRSIDGVTMMLIWGLLPLVAPLLSPLLIGERLRLDIVIGAALAFSGVAIGALSRQSEGWASPEGVALSATAVVMASLGYMLGRVVNRDGGTWRRSAALQITGGALASLTFSVFFLEDGFGLPPLADQREFLIFGYLILIMTVANFLLFNYALAAIPAAAVALYSALGPAFGAIAAWFFLGDRIRPTDLFTITLVVIGVAIPGLVQLRRRIRQPRPPGPRSEGGDLP